MHPLSWLFSMLFHEPLLPYLTCACINRHHVHIPTTANIWFVVNPQAHIILIQWYNLVLIQLAWLMYAYLFYLFHLFEIRRDVQLQRTLHEWCGVKQLLNSLNQMCLVTHGQSSVNNKRNAFGSSMPNLLYIEFRNIWPYIDVHIFP